VNPDECPMCDAGVIARYRVNATGESIQVCDECDSVWEEADELPGPATATVGQFLAARGLPLLWSQLSALA
jgi:ribosome-binding protein aMBF1 (putative translation factor)